MKPDKHLQKFESQGTGENRIPSIRLTRKEGKSKELLLNVNTDQQQGMISLNIRFVGLMTQGQACSGIFEISDKIYFGFKPGCLNASSKVARTRAINMQQESSVNSMLRKTPDQVSATTRRSSIFETLESQKL